MSPSGASELPRLVVVDRLEVGPVKVEGDRIAATYRAGDDSFELAYKYEEPVFDPQDPEASNLASVILAQVALNYGLFCREIVFHGSFDEADRRFLTEMAANTAREIYVNKILEPNPFLTDEVSGLPAQIEKSYLAASLTFEGERPSPEAPRWPSSPERHAVLSSGGKDSLLTFGLLREIGVETHPIYVNESGRHWFTALNAYRHFALKVPNTARVWTNSDRLFSWMLRQLPFVRKDFQSVRSDAYPIRLWTVAVFLFGVLPLLRKRGIGRLLIGDEFDTTERASFQGITHYNGLYDQSRYFDEALTRYFGRKGYGFSQFSILRPCSEILIEKVLAERYPALLEYQMSCHATHKEEATVRPCGACEKCRRIVGMLLAVGQDPRRCGFGDEQIESSLASLVENGVHQERAGAAHMGYLLHERGRIAEPRVGKVAAKPQPEVMKLRFDPERSPIGGIPVNLREPVFRILLQHAEGSLQRSGRLWQPFDVLGSAELRTPYRFEAGKEASGVSIAEPGFVLGELTWPEAQERIRQVDVALLPVGAIEQHGPHLPIDTDAFDADYLAKRVAAACPEPKPLVLPLIPYGVSYAHEDFSGTLSVSPDTMARLVYEIGMSAARQGITKLVVVNGHGGNAPALHFAAQLINRDAHIFTCVDTGETSDAEVNAMSGVPNDVHAGDIETSTALAVRPELVRMDRAEKFIPRFSSRYLDFTGHGGVGWYARTAKISPSGVLGDPTRATREKGERMWEVMVEHLVRLVTSIQGLSLDEVYQSGGARPPSQEASAARQSPPGGGGRAPSSPSGSEEPSARAHGERSEFRSESAGGGAPAQTVKNEPRGERGEHS